MLRAFTIVFFSLFFVACDSSSVQNKASKSVSEEANHGSKLTPERLVGSPRLSGPRIRGLKISSDGSRITFLRGKADAQTVLDLWEYSIADNEIRMLVDSADLVDPQRTELSEEEKARRERRRISEAGIVEYEWNEEGTSLLFPLGGDIYHLPLGGELKKLTDSAIYETDVKFSPKGNFASFIEGKEIHIVEIATGRRRKLTSGASETISNGMAEYIAQEELGRHTGYWWSPDETKIAFTQVDEAQVDLVQRYEITSDGSVKSTPQRYPYAGTNNAEVKLGIIEVATGEIIWIDLKQEQEFYVARVDWLPDSKSLSYQILPRDQKSLDLVLYDTATGARRTIVREESATWINLSDDLKFIGDGQFIWTSERSGYRHIYLYNTPDGTFRQLTSGEWVIDEVKTFDKERKLLYFTGFKDTVLENHLYVVSTEPNKSPDIRRITKESGWHWVSMGKKGSSVFVDTFSSADHPWQLAIKNIDTGDTLEFILENKLDETHPYAEYLAGHAEPQFGSLEAEDGARLDYKIILPTGFDDKLKYPAILLPYGGPHGHRVRNSWSLGMEQVYAREGFIVMTLDNRGSYNRGTAFESHVYRAMGSVEVKDQVACAEYLMTLPYVDAENIGIQGWSYGGYLALMALFQAPDTFKAGIAGAPVTDWRLYDTAYTERYLGHPDDPGGVYEASSVFAHIEGFKGKLLIVHGMADDNVFFDNSIRLMHELQLAGKPFELMTYPGQKHGIYDMKKRAHAYQTELDFFNRHLKPWDKPT